MAAIAARAASGGRRLAELLSGSSRPVVALWSVAALWAADAVGLRFAAPSPLWLDEALSVNIAALPVGEAVQALRHDGHPLLYYGLLGTWMDVFGDSDAAVRSLSAVASLGAAAAVWAATRLRFGPVAARYGAVLALTSPFGVRYGSEARMYALALLLAAVGWWLTETALQERRPWRLAALAATTAAALHTHYWMIWLVAAAGGTLAAGWLARPERRRALTPVLAALAVGGATFVPWAPVLAEQAAHTGTPWATWARPAEVVIETVQALGGGRRFEPMLLGVVLIGAAVLGATLLRTGDGTVELGWPGRHRGAALVAVPAATLAAGGVVAMVSGHAFEARYAAVVLPLLLGLAARGLAGLPGRWAPAALAAVAVFSVAVAVDEARRDRTQGEEVADAIDAAAGGDAVATGEAGAVVFCPDQLAPAVLRYLDTPVAVLTHPPTENPELVDWYDYRDRIDAADAERTADAARAAAGDGPVWLVSASGYRGFEEACPRLASALGRGRASETLVAARPVYEPMSLRRYGVEP